ncbi:MAG: chromate transporter [Eubacteriales bacterium]|nr:chromate transporter [Eubacteriales bacterium]
MDTNKRKKFIKLFLSTFKLSACTFGGGFVIIPLLRQKFVDELKWIDEQEMMDLTAIAQSSPGAIAVNASIVVGYHVAGVPGALISILGTVLPPLVIISVISFFYQAFRDNAIVNMAMAGMLCGVAAVIFDVVINMAKTIFKQHRILPILVMAGSFIAVRFFSVNIMFIILACGIIGAADVWYQEKRRKEGASK